MSWKNLGLLGLAVLVGCGGDDNNGNGGGSASGVLTGVLLDSPVINISYETATQTGVTNAQGEFSYRSGEVVIFSIGDLQLPAVPGAAVVTPLDMIRTGRTTDFRVLNILRLLQTLDEDGDPDNGIRITDTAANSATQVDFGLLEADFAASSAVVNLIFNGGQFPVATQLVPTADARAHFEAVLVERGIPFGTIAEQNEAAILKYLADNNLQATRHASGLYYQITEPGSGGFPTTSSTVQVKYKGSLINGTIFDQTSGDNTASFALGGLIRGWQIGVPLLQRGGKGILYIPSALGYGETGNGSVPANSVLIFEIELVNF